MPMTTAGYALSKPDISYIRKRNHIHIYILTAATHIYSTSAHHYISCLHTNFSFSYSYLPSRFIGIIYDSYYTFTAFWCQQIFY